MVEEGATLSDMEESAGKVQQCARSWNARRHVTARRWGKKAHAADEANRAKLSAWVEQQVGKKYPDNASASVVDVAVFTATLEKRQNYRTTLEKKTAAKVADFQRKRAAKVKGGRDAIRNWLPPGVDVALDGKLGRMLVATRDYRPGDIVVVEKVALVAESNGVFTDDWSPKEQEQLFTSQVNAFAKADELTRRRVLGMHAKSASDELTTRLSLFAKKLGPSVPPTGTVTGPDAASTIPRIFQGNSVQVNARTIVLPIVGSLFNHSCDANLLRQYSSSSAEFIASRRIRVGEQLTIDYLGGKLWGRQRRREHLRLSKDFDCSCARCTRPEGDRETSLVCPACLPVGENEDALIVREGGFCVPIDVKPADESRFGYITLMGGSNCNSGAGEWKCSKNCAHVFSTSDLQAIALPTHTEAPVGNYHELLKYAESLAQELEDATDETIASGVGQQYHLAIRMSVGVRHWASHVWPLRMLRLREAHPAEYACTLLGGGEDDEEGGAPIGSEATAMTELCWWVGQWLKLDPALYIGPAALLDAAVELARFVGTTGTLPVADSRERIAEVRGLLQLITDEGSSVPRTSEVYAAAMITHREVDSKLGAQ
jgi:hypothetical protein